MGNKKWGVKNPYVSRVVLGNNGHKIGLLLEVFGKLVDFKKMGADEIKEKRKQQEIEEDLIQYTCGFTGHRPNKLNNCYSLKHSESIKIMNKLTPVLKTLVEQNNIYRFITGGAIGFDQIAFWTVEKMKKEYNHLTNIVAVPFKQQSCKWADEETLYWYDKMLKKADKVVYVDELPAYKVEGAVVGEYHVAKMQKRNEYMVDYSNIMIACWDGTKGGTGNCVKYINRSHKTLYQMLPQDDYKLIIHN